MTNHPTHAAAQHLGFIGVMRIWLDDLEAHFRADEPEAEAVAEAAEVLPAPVGGIAKDIAEGLDVAEHLTTPAAAADPSIGATTAGQESPADGAAPSTEDSTGQESEPTPADAPATSVTDGGASPADATAAAAEPTPAEALAAIVNPTRGFAGT